MTPAARYRTAMECLDAILAGAPAERVLTNWARASRFAGSKDRAAVRDIVFSALRQKRSLAWRAGEMSGRGLVIGLLDQEDNGFDLLDGSAYGAPPLTAEERARMRRLEDAPRAVRLDIPDFLEPVLERSLGPDLEPVLTALKQRAPTDLRVNLSRGSREAAQAVLAADGVNSEALDLAPTALRVTEGARRVAQSAAYREGLIELQDLSSQLVAHHAAAHGGTRILDFCAGGGGKTLALADLTGQRIYAHDKLGQRMKDLPERAARAQAAVTMLDAPETEAPFDHVLADAPCSGSGAWRRQADAKWRLTEADLDGLLAAQREVMDAAAALVAPGGALVYATCSLLAPENEDQTQDFLERHKNFILVNEQHFRPPAEGDGFYVASFRHN
ncbi:RsmB/NOP family class I SAM-dependent RNA methyltransferase [Paracoccaceae bacterium GXU_MW_L88]